MQQEITDIGWVRLTSPEWTTPIYDPVRSDTLVDERLVERAPDWEALGKL